jgi:hypothetical protein
MTESENNKDKGENMETAPDLYVAPDNTKEPGEE